MDVQAVVVLVALACDSMRHATHVFYTRAAKGLVQALYPPLPSRRHALLKQFKPVWAQECG